MERFQFTHPVRGATILFKHAVYNSLFQFTHPVRGATKNGMSCPISKLVSIHAPRAGCDIEARELDVTRPKFQFTHPVRGATNNPFNIRYNPAFQFTHPVRGATATPCNTYY